MTLDPRRIGISLSNIISNAVKFTPKDGKVEVWVGVQPPLHLSSKSNLKGNENHTTSRPSLHEKIMPRSSDFLYIDVVDTGKGLSQVRHRRCLSHRAIFPSD